jgi:proline dehydrogenase
MLRAFFLYLSQSALMRRLLTGFWLSRRVASRFIAGDNLEQAVEVIKALNAEGFYATLDHLGENVANLADAEGARQDYIDLIDRINAESLEAGISLKLTQLGLELDPAACLDSLRRIAERAKEHGIFVRIDMEHFEVLEDTLDIYWELHASHFKNVGVVIQSYLRRSQDDVQDLIADHAKIRLVKGAYDEPASVAFPQKREVDEEYDLQARLMIEEAANANPVFVPQDGMTPPMVALGTHDDQRIELAISYAQSVGLPKEALEIQLLHGIRTDLGRQLMARGYPVRIYVPYGTEWYPYFMRRLAERPANVWFFISNLFRG